MSTTDLLNGPIEDLPSWNVKNNPTVTDLNSSVQITNITPLLYAILQNQQYLETILSLKNKARDYYNRSRRHFCRTVNLNAVSGFNQERITVFLPSAGGILTNDPLYVNYAADYAKNTLLMRVLPTGVLPTVWGDSINRATGLVESISVPVSLLTDNEKVIYMYIKNADFFTRILQLFKNSFQYYTDQKFQCYTIVLPSDFYDGTLQERTFVTTTEYLRNIYRNFLANPTFVPYQALPAPICITNPVPCAPWTPETEPI